MLRLNLSILLCAALLCSCRTAAPNPPPPPDKKEQTTAAPKEPIRITIMGTNDLHGWLFPQKSKLPSGVEIEEGGLSVLAGYIAIARADNPNGFLLFDGGDLFQGTLAANLTEGAPVIEALNKLGYDAVAIGNHEFDYGPVGPVSVATEASMDPFGALKERLKQAKFPLLATNIYDANTGERPKWLGNDGTVILERNGVKVGVLGLITPQTPYTTNPMNVATLRFGSLVPETVAAAKRLREQGAHLVVAISHAGGKCADISDPRNTSSCDTKDGEIFDLLANIPEGTLDAVVAGHTHGPMGHFINGTPVIETWGLGRFFGMIELFVDPTSKKVLADKTRIQAVVPVCEKVDETLKTCESRRLKGAANVKLVDSMFLGKAVVRDPAVDAIVKPAFDRVEREEKRKLGLTVTSTMGRNYEAESALGSFLADSLRESEKADVSLLNSGGLRADLPAGELTYGHVYNVLPFDNTVATVTVTGEELKRLLNAAYGARKGVFQVSGLKISIAKCPGQGRLKSYVLSDGKAVQPEKRYRVVMPDFLARGGDGLGPVLQSLPPGRIDLGMSRGQNFRDSLVAYWTRTARPLVAPKLGRISFVDDGTSCNAGEKLDRH